MLGGPVWAPWVTEAWWSLRRESRDRASQPVQHGTAGYHTHWWSDGQTLALHCCRSRDLHTNPTPFLNTHQDAWPGRVAIFFFSFFFLFFFSDPPHPSTCYFLWVWDFEADLAHHHGVSSCPTLGWNNTPWYTNVFGHINTHPYKSTSLRPGVRLTYSKRTMPFLTRSTINKIKHNCIFFHFAFFGLFRAISAADFVIYEALPFLFGLAILKAKLFLLSERWHQWIVWNVNFFLFVCKNE